jgi:catalase
MLRDGFHQDAVPADVAPYKPNSLDGGCPFHAGADDGAYIDVPQPVAKSVKVRRSPASFANHFTQPRLFYKSLSAVEKEHLVRAFTFELGKCYEQAIKVRELQILANVDSELCAQVAAGLGLPAPKPSKTAGKVMSSPALFQLGRTWPVDGRIIGIVVDPAQLAGVRQLRDAMFTAGMVPLLIAPHVGTLLDGELQAQRTFLTARSVEFDALRSPPARQPPRMPSQAATPRQATPDDESTVDPRVIILVQECFRHAKAIGAWGSGTLALEASGYGQDNLGVVDDDPDDVLKQIMTLLSTHRVWERFPPAIT